MSRERVRHLSLMVAIAALATAGVVRLAGGYEFTLFDTTIRGHRVDRLIILGVAAFAAYVAAGGRLLALQNAWNPAWRRLNTSVVLASRAVAIAFRLIVRPRLLITLLVIGVVADGWLFGARAAGGSDSFGYVSQAHRWLDGTLVQPQPWTERVPWPNGPQTFQLLGYTRQNTSTTVPTYPSGLSLLMALAIAIGGACGAFVVAPVMGAGAVVLTYELGRRLATAWTGVAAAWLLATSPAFLYMLGQPMSDVPVMTMWLGAWLAALSARRRMAALSGVLVGYAVLTRPNLAPLASAVVFWYFVRPTPDGAGRFAWAWPRAASFVAGTIPGLAVMFGLNTILYGGPLRTGYGSATDYFDIAHAVPNIRLYADWLTTSQTPLVWVGIAAIALPALGLRPTRQGRAFAMATGLFSLLLVGQYLLYTVFENWWYLRFLLPVLPFVFFGMAQVAVRFARISRITTSVSIALLIVVGVHGLWFGQREWAFGNREGHANFAVAARAVRGATEPNSVIYSMQHSGSVELYAGRQTIRFDVMSSEWLDRSVLWFAERGNHPYALLEEWEVEHWVQRFGGRAHFGALPAHPIRRLANGGALYDLLASGPAEPRVVPLTDVDLDCRAPVPEPAHLLP